MKKLVDSGEYKVRNGLVLTKEGKFITGDVDVFDVVSHDGTPVRESVKKRVLSSLEKHTGSNIKHRDLMSWGESDPEFSAKAKEKMIDAASGSKGVTSYNPMAKPTSQRYVRP